jgi:hypothetical protein
MRLVLVAMNRGEVSLLFSKDNPTKVGPTAAGPWEEIVKVAEVRGPLGEGCGLEFREAAITLGRREADARASVPLMVWRRKREGVWERLPRVFMGGSLAEWRFCVGATCR